MAREKMSSVDTAWLRMDSPQNLMMIIGFQVFEQRMELRRLRELLEKRLLKFKRFRQKVETDATGAWWVTDRQFDLDNHLTTVQLPGIGDQAQLQAMIGELASQALDPRRPLWHFHIVENYDGSNALISRIHHCIADGMALVAVMMSLTDGTGVDDDKADNADKAGNPDDDQRGRTADEWESNPWQPYVRPITKGTIKAINATASAWTKSLEILAQPDKLVGYGEVASQVVKDALRIALMPNDSSTSLKGKPGTRKAVAWNKPLPLDEVKTVCKALGASINDVLLSCVAGALRSYLIANDEDTQDCEIRAMVPVNLRPLTQVHRLGNRFGLVPLTLPVGMANPIARLREVHARMDELKGGYQALLAFGVLGVLGSTPKPVQTFVLDMLANKATAVMTNVPGPAQPIHMAGTAVSRIMFWVPQSGNVGLGVSILSYNGGVQFGVITDTRLCPEPQKIIDGFAPEFEKLVLLLAMLPAEMFNDPSIEAEQFEQALFG